MRGTVGAVLLCSLALLAAGAEKPPCSYVVQGGDSLFEIGQMYGLTAADIEESNPDMEAIIQPGDILTLPCNQTATKGSSILDLLAHREDMTVLFQAVVAANFTDMLADEKLEGTLFAPNNTAFGLLLARLNMTAGDLLADKELLTTVLLYHFVPEVVLNSEDFQNGDNITTALTGQTLTVYKPKQVLRLTMTGGKKARVEEVDLEAGDAVVHTLRSVLWPAKSLGELPEPTGNCIHEVVSGDTLFNIAQEYDTTTASLIDLNPDLEADGGQSLALGTELILFPSCA